MAANESPQATAATMVASLPAKADVGIIRIISRRNPVEGRQPSGSTPSCGGGAAIAGGVNINGVAAKRRAVTLYSVELVAAAGGAASTHLAWYNLPALSSSASAYRQPSAAGILQYEISGGWRRQRVT